MNLNLSKFKKISDDKHSAVLKHPAGHSIRVAKKSLSPKMQAELESIPVHLEGGGMAKEENQSIDPSIGQGQMAQAQPAVNIINVGQPQQQPATPPMFGLPHSAQEFGQRLGQGVSGGIKAYGSALGMIASPIVNAGKGLIQGLAGNEAQAAPEMPQAPQIQNASLEQPQNLQMAAPQAPAAPVDQDPYGNQAYLNSYTQGLSEQKRGLMGESAALGQKGQAEATAYQQGTQQLQAKLNDFEQEKTNLFKERENLQADLKNGHIDPNRFLNNMSLGKKLSTSVGLILGGMGAGSSGANPVFEHLQGQINRDIEAQRAELGKKQSLLDINFKQFGNLKDATQMTQLMMMDMVKNNIAEAGAKSQDPLAKARAQQAIGQIDTQAAPIMSQIAMRRTMMGAMNSGEGPGANDKTAQLISVLRMTNPELAKSYESRFIPTVGLAQVPVPDKVREELVSRHNLDGAIADLRKFSEDHQGTVLDRASVAEGKAKSALVQDMYRRANAQGVFREAEKDFVETIVDQDPTKFFASWRIDPKYRALEEDNLRQMEGVKKSYGLPVAYKPPSAKPYLGSR